LGLTGPPGDAAILILAAKPAFAYEPPFHGVRAYASPSVFVFRRLGRIGTGGMLNTSYPIGDIVGPEPGWIWYAQILSREPSTTRYLSTPLQILIENT
jgi:hypothetical protein